MALGPHKIEYEVIKGWEQMPEGYSFIEVAGVACDSKDHVYVFNRGKYPIIIFETRKATVLVGRAGQRAGAVHTAARHRCG